MTAELVRGQNHPLPETRLEIRVSAGHPVVAGVTRPAEQCRVTGVERIAHPGAPALPGIGVPGRAAADHRLTVDLDTVPDAVHRVSVLLALTGAAPRFGALAAPFVAVAAADGEEIASYTLTGLDRETAVVALELYRRQGTWKVRAMGQGYEGGLAALLGDQGLERPEELAASILAAVAPERERPTEPAAPRLPQPERVHHTAPPSPEPTPVPPSAPVPAPAPAPASGGPLNYAHPRRAAAPAPEPRQAPPAPVAGDASGWSMDERLYNQVWGMFEDLARTAAAYRSARDFAESRLDRELDETLTDYRAGAGAANDAARAPARARPQDAGLSAA
ncbi:TerD family protein, partial [Streptomyces sp. NPDC059082]|uniref:TerD family protein n=1 Tax=Streptomyces sp. NPDC059082 TaxID=3346720 RepID=UPI0036A93138